MKNLRDMEPKNQFRMYAPLAKKKNKAKHSAIPRVDPVMCAAI